MIITITLNPAIDKTAQLDAIQVNGLNRLENVLVQVGGKGINVSKTLKAMHEDSVACGFVGGNNGNFIKQTLEELSITHNMVEVEGETRVNLKVLDAQMELTELNEVGQAVTSKNMDDLMTVLDDIVQKEDIVVISGSAPKGVPINIYETITKAIVEKGARVLLDADKDLFKEGVKATPTLIKPNKYELCQYFDVNESIEDKALLALTRSFIDQGIEYVVISMGKEGAYFLCKECTYFVQGLKVNAHSSVGAGDAMVAALAYALNHNYSVEDLITLSVACSAGAVETKGTQPASMERIEELKQKVVIKEI